MPQTTNRALTVVGLILALAMAALEATVVATAMPTVIGELGGIHYYAWVTNAYLIASSVTVPIYGKLADIYGRKPILLFGIAVFLFGSAASGAAHSIGQLIVFRAIQGVGAGSMQPVALTVVGDIFDLKERSRMQGLFGAAWGFFGLTGPLIGGLIVHYMSWRWVFYINLPFGVAASVLIITSLFERIEKKPHKLDFLGAGLLTLTVVSLLRATDSSAPSSRIVLLVVAALLIAAFVAVERRAAEPVMPLSLFSRRVILLSSITGALIGGAMMALTTYVPLFVQSVLHGTPTEVGSAITPMLITWPVASTLSGRFLPRFGFRPMIWIGIGLTVAAAIALALFGTHDDLNKLRLTSAAFGCGMGLANTALVILVQTSVTWNERGIATASTMFFRTIGGAVAVGVGGGVLGSALRGDSSLPEDSVSKLLTREGLRSLDPHFVEHVGAILQQALGTIFWFIAAIAAAGFVFCLFFPELPTTKAPEASSSDGKALGTAEATPPPGH